MGDRFDGLSGRVSCKVRIGDCGWVILGFVLMVFVCVLQCDNSRVIGRNKWDFRVRGGS